MPDTTRSRRVGVRFLWRCLRDGIMPRLAMRRIVISRVVGAVPVVRKRWERSAEEIMHAAAEMRRMR